MTKSFFPGHIAEASHPREFPMATNKAPENMTYAELVEFRARVDVLMLQKKTEARAGFRQKIAKLAKKEGLKLTDVLEGRRRGRKSKGSVAIKYRDNNGNTWTGRGRMPRWMVAATKNGRAKKNDFLV